MIPLFSALRACAPASAILLLAASCDFTLSDDRPGKLSFHFSNASYIGTKSVADLPDTNSFILTVTDSKGETLYDGLYGSSPELLDVTPGTYTVSVVSAEFKVPKFSSPQYGDRQVVVVSSGGFCNIELVCRQMNAGITLRVAPNFLTSYPNGSLFLKNSDGRITYGYSEKRTAYFRPGAVSLYLSNGASDELLLTRTLESQEMLTLNVSAPSVSSSGSGGLSIQIDTARYWLSEDYVIGQDTAEGTDKELAYNVGQAKTCSGREDVWVYGYIVGGDLSSSSASFRGPFTSRTNIIIASRASATSKESCMSVQLQKGNIRDALNLVDNPDNLGCEVFLKGDLVESYYGIPGIQNITEYEVR